MSKILLILNQYNMMKFKNLKSECHSTKYLEGKYILFALYSVQTVNLKRGRGIISSNSQSLGLQATQVLGGCGNVIGQRKQENFCKGLKAFCSDAICFYGQRAYYFVSKLKSGLHNALSRPLTLKQRMTMATTRCLSWRQPLCPFINHLRLRRGINYRANVQEQILRGSGEKDITSGPFG